MHLKTLRQIIQNLAQVTDFLNTSHPPKNCNTANFPKIACTCAIKTRYINIAQKYVQKSRTNCKVNYTVNNVYQNFKQQTVSRLSFGMFELEIEFVNHMLVKIVQ